MFSFYLLEKKYSDQESKTLKRGFSPLKMKNLSSHPYSSLPLKVRLVQLSID